MCVAGHMLPLPPTGLALFSGISVVSCPFVLCTVFSELILVCLHSAAIPAQILPAGCVLLSMCVVWSCLHNWGICGSLGQAVGLQISQ